MESGNLDIPLQKMAVMTKNILAIIPARGGSKGIPKKNIIDLAGKPLIAWTIEASLNSKYISKTIVSSDSEEILDISKKFGADIVKRPDILANDTASSESVVNHVIKTLSEQYQYIILLQPTSPLRNSETIDKAIEYFFSKNATSLISVNEIDNKILKAFVEKDDDFLEGIRDNTFPFMPRQKLPKIYMSNGAIYMINTKDFLKNQSFFTDKTLKFIMNKEQSIDIDTLEDLEEAKSLL